MKFVVTLFQIRHPIGYYTLLRFVVCAVCAAGVWLALKWKQTGWTFAFGALAGLFQPLVNLRITRPTWNYVDVAMAGFLILTVFLFKENKHE